MRSSACKPIGRRIIALDRNLNSSSGTLAPRTAVAPASLAEQHCRCRRCCSRAVHAHQPLEQQLANSADGAQKDLHHYQDDGDCRCNVHVDRPRSVVIALVIGEAGLGFDVLTENSARHSHANNNQGHHHDGAKHPKLNVSKHCETPLVFHCVQKYLSSGNSHKNAEGLTATAPLPLGGSPKEKRSGVTCTLRRCLIATLTEYRTRVQIRVSAGAPARGFHCNSVYR